MTDQRKTKDAFLAFSAIYGDEAGERNVRPYLYSEFGLYDLLQELMPCDRYGRDLRLILIQLYVKGEHDWFSVPGKPGLGRYSANESAVEYSVPVTQENYFDLPPPEKKEFILRQIADAIAAAKARLKKKGMQIDFEKMQADFEKLRDAYRKRPLPTDVGTP